MEWGNSSITEAQTVLAVFARVTDLGEAGAPCEWIQQWPQDFTCATGKVDLCCI